RLDCSRSSTSDSGRATAPTGRRGRCVVGFAGGTWRRRGASPDARPLLRSIPYGGIGRAIYNRLPFGGAVLCRLLRLALLARTPPSGEPTTGCRRMDGV